MTKDDKSLQGLGIDIIEIERIERSLSRYGQRFLARLFTQRELDYCNKHNYRARHLAGRFAAKEAVAKALGCGIGENLSWKDIEILNNASGQPVVHLSPHRANHFGHPRLLLSISHCKAYANAVALWTKT